ncbi:hypothetical protein M432DRAFT_380217 [Thermoascus aurantiacus ATCC 26904]
MATILLYYRTICLISSSLLCYPHRNNTAWPVHPTLLDDCRRILFGSLGTASRDLASRLRRRRHGEAIKERRSGIREEVREAGQEAELGRPWILISTVAPIRSRRSSHTTRAKHQRRRIRTDRSRTLARERIIWTHPGFCILELTEWLQSQGYPGGSMENKRLLINTLLEQSSRTIHLCVTLHRVCSLNSEIQSRLEILNYDRSW